MVFSKILKYAKIYVGLLIWDMKIPETFVTLSLVKI